jgi:hypothetical protein
MVIEEDEEALKGLANEWIRVEQGFAWGQQPAPHAKIEEKKMGNGGGWLDAW